MTTVEALLLLVYSAPVLIALFVPFLSILRRGGERATVRGGRRGTGTVGIRPAGMFAKAQSEFNSVSGKAVFEYRVFKGSAIATANGTSITGVIQPPEGWPCLVGVHVRNVDISATATDNGGIEHWFIADSTSKINERYAERSHGIGVAAIQSDVSATDSRQKTPLYALVNWLMGTERYQIFVKSAVVTTEVEVLLVYSKGMVDPRTMMYTTVMPEFRNAYVATVNIGTTFEDFFADDFAVPDAFPWIGAVMVRNNEIADTLGITRYQIVDASDKVQVGPSGHIGDSALIGDVSAAMPYVPDAMPQIINRPANGNHNVQALAEVADTNGTCNILFSNMRIDIHDLLISV